MKVDGITVKSCRPAPPVSSKFFATGGAYYLQEVGLSEVARVANSLFKNHGIVRGQLFYVATTATGAFQASLQDLGVVFYFGDEASFLKEYKDKTFSRGVMLLGLMPSVGLEIHRIPLEKDNDIFKVVCQMVLSGMSSEEIADNIGIEVNPQEWAKLLGLNVITELSTGKVLL